MYTKNELFHQRPWNMSSKSFQILVTFLGYGRVDNLRASGHCPMWVDSPRIDGTCTLSHLERNDIHQSSIYLIKIEKT